MLWYKAWLETRFRLLFLVGLILLFRGVVSTGVGRPLPALVRLQSD